MTTPLRSWLLLLSMLGGAAIASVAAGSPSSKDSTQARAALHTQALSFSLPDDTYLSTSWLPDGIGGYYACAPGPYDVSTSSSPSLIIRLAPDGTSSLLATVNGGGPIATGAACGWMVVGADHNLYMSHAPRAGGIVMVTPDGVVTETNYSTSIAAYDLVIGKNGTIYAIGGPKANNSEAADAGPFSLVQLTPDGAVTTIYSFPASQYPSGPLFAAGDGNFYVITNSVSGSQVDAVLNRITPAGSVTAIHDFGANTADDAISGTLILGGDGNFYGFTGGGANGAGTVFKLGTNGVFTTLHSFGLITTANLYTYPRISCGKFPPYCQWIPGHWGQLPTGLNADGLGAQQIYSSYNPAPDTTPLPALILAPDGTLYGMTSGSAYSGGAFGAGTLFRIGADGSFDTIYSFHDATEWVGGLAEDSQGNLLGITRGSLDRVLLKQNYVQPVIQQLVLNDPLTVNVSLSPSVVNAGGSSTLTWSSSGAHSCLFSGDMPGISYVTSSGPHPTQKATTLSGHRTVFANNWQIVTPGQFVIVLQCQSADGALATSTATLTIQ